MSGDAERAPSRTRDVRDTIRAALEGLRFGSVTIHVQDGMVVQIERTEKLRPRAAPERA
jgi:hypothetical protein